MNERLLDGCTINAHSSIRIAVPEGPVVYVDPFRLTEELCDADVIFVTHPHFDHFSPEDIRRVRKDDTVLVLPKAMAETEDEAIRSAIEALAFRKIIQMEPNAETELVGIAVRSVPSYNVGKPMHRKEYGWLGYVLTVADTAIYIAGDTDVNEDIQSVHADLAFVPVGGTYTMDAPEAASLVNQIRPEVAVPTHYGEIVGEADAFDRFRENVEEQIRVVRMIREKAAESCEKAR